MQPIDPKEQDRIPRTIRFAPETWKALAERVYAAKIRGEKAGFDAEVNRAVEAWLEHHTYGQPEPPGDKIPAHQRQIGMLLEILDSGDKRLVEAINSALKALSGVVRERKTANGSEGVGK